MKHLLAIAAALCLAATASAHPDGAKKMAFENVDKDGDGMISRAEAEASGRLDKHFDAIDGDKDGQLTRDEMQAFATQRAERMREHAAKAFSEADTDGDGRVSKAEAEKAWPRVAGRFEHIDADKDGYLTEEEMHARHRGHDKPHGEKALPET